LVECWYCKNHPDEPGTTKCTNCKERFCWSANHIEGPSAKNPTTGKSYPIHPNTLQRHRCFSDARQQGRDANIPTSADWKPGELQALRESVARKDEIRLAALEALFKPNLKDREEILKEKPELKPEPQKRL
jgi:hypothetical protein